MPDKNGNRAVWESASLKHVMEYDDLLEQARAERLIGAEGAVLTPVLAGGRVHVVHLQSGHGVDDHALLKAGARSVLGVDYSTVAATAAQRRAADLRAACQYIVASIPPVPLRSGCADVIYTGKGALIWIVDLAAWAAEVVRLLHPGGHLFVLESHPLVPLWSWDEDEVRLRQDRSYFMRSFVNDTFPAGGAVEQHRTLAEIVMTIEGAGLQILHLAEHPEPFWRPGSLDAAAWRGQLPNTFTLLARRG